MATTFMATLQAINCKFRAAAIAIANGTTARPIRTADEFFEAIANIPISGPSADLAITAFNSIIEQVELLTPDRAFDPMLLAAETLAACLLRSTEYDRIVRDWARRDHAVGMMAVGRAYSKVADFDTSRIDRDVLLGLAVRLGGACPLSREERTSLAYLGRIAGKLKATPIGIALIEKLAQQGPECRAIAAHAIAFDAGLASSRSYLSIFDTFGGHPAQSVPPPRRLFWLFASLRYDPDAAVSSQANAAFESIRLSSPDVWNNLASMKFSGNWTSEAGPPPENVAPVDDADTAVSRALERLATRTGCEWDKNDLRALTHDDLARPAGSAVHPRGVEFALRFPQQSNATQGVLTWDPSLLKQEAALAAGGAVSRPIGAPRLFISYRWSQSVGDIGWLDFFAGRLHMSGYDIVYDRDPRHIEKGLDSSDVLLLMFGCTHFVPIVTTDTLMVLRKPVGDSKSPLELEWQLARRLSGDQPPLRWLGIWRSGGYLPQPLTKKSVVDVRESSTSLDRMFPSCTFRVVSTLKSGTLEASDALCRIDILEAIAAAKANPECLFTRVYDITERGSAWNGFSPAGGGQISVVRRKE